jgi:hypothetical protein
VKLSTSDYTPKDSPDSTPQLSDFVRETASFVENATFSAGRYNSRDIREGELVGQFIEQGSIDEIAAVHQGDSSVRLSDSGWIDFHIPDEVDPTQRANVIRNRVDLLLR